MYKEGTFLSSVEETITFLEIRKEILTVPLQKNKRVGIVEWVVNHPTINFYIEFFTWKKVEILQKLKRKRVIFQEKQKTKTSVTNRCLTQVLG